MLTHIYQMTEQTNKNMNSFKPTHVDLEALGRFQTWVSGRMRGTHSAGSSEAEAVGPNRPEQPLRESELQRVQTTWPLTDNRAGAQAPAIRCSVWERLQSGLRNRTLLKTGQQLLDFVVCLQS